jgi:hypothetical protein
MTEKVRDKLVTSLFSFLLSITVFVIGFWLTGMRVSEENIDTRLNQKVDKEQYDKDCKAKDQMMKSYEIQLKENETTQKELITLLYGINTKLSSIETDIAWLKRKYK